MTMVQRRLILTPKSSSPLGFVPLRPEVAKLLDPNPDFDLLDVRLELEEIEAKHRATSGSLSCFLDGAAPAPSPVKR